MAKWTALAKTEAEERRALVLALNTADSDCSAARDRLNKAVDAVTEIESRRQDLRNDYEKASVELLEAKSVNRLTLCDLVNMCLASLADTSVDFHKARSEKGTAEAQVERFEAERAEIMSRLVKLLPKSIP